MKKYRFVLAMMLLMMLVSGCSKAYIPGQDDGKINIVCTTFPQYDWTKNLIAGQEDMFEVRLLLDQGTDMHNYQPTAEDIVIITECDLLIYGGGESEAWVFDAVKNKDIHTICMMDVLGDMVKDEVVVEGMQEGREEEKEDSSAISGDEHIWLSLANAKVLVRVIAEEISMLDPEHKSDYQNNMMNYVNCLEVLNQQYESVVENGTNDTILFADRFPFLYMMDDYAVNYYAAFTGCSAETEASFETITFLAEKLDEYGLSCVVVLEHSDVKLAETVIGASKDKSRGVVEMHAMQSVTKKEIENGASYIGFMEQNLEALKQALN